MPQRSGFHAKPSGKAARRYQPVPVKLRKRRDGEKKAKARRAGAAGEGFNWPLPSRAQLKGLLEGRTLQAKDFKQHACIGKGSFAFVHVVTLRSLPPEAPLPMAMKTLSKMHLLASSQLQHVKAEQMIMQEMDCPFVVSFLKAFQDDRRVYFILEYAHGGDLFAQIGAEGRLPDDHAKFYAAELLMVFHTLESHGIVYRDLKPENILIDRDGHVKLCDFGFAKALDPGVKAFTVVGCPEYLAPEVLHGQGHSHEADFWSLGVLIFEMLAGYPPFTAATPYDIYVLALAGVTNFPRHFDVKAVNLLTLLLVKDETQRANLSVCMRHLWFQFVEWDDILEKKIKPPFRPFLDDPLDTRFFEVVPDSEFKDAEAPPVSRKAQRLFNQFR